MEFKYNWTKQEIKTVYNTPVLDLIYQAASVHRNYHNPNEIQICSLISIKTGGCSEDCKYCPQAARYQTDVNAMALMEEEQVLKLAQAAIIQGASRICLGAAWRSVRDSSQFDRILKIVKKITDMRVEVCCTLGMLNTVQAAKLKECGLYAYNHNLDTSKEFYSSIITSRRYEDRLQTLDIVEKVGIKVCCGGIIGMGESEEDRIGLLYSLASRNPQPESVPINVLIPVQGTPLENETEVSTWEWVRMVATARIIMPKAMIRLSAGRLGRSIESQALCFLSGANSIFMGDKLLTRPNPNSNEDLHMLHLLGLTSSLSFKESYDT